MNVNTLMRTPQRARGEHARDEQVRRVLRGVISLLVALAILDVVWHHISLTLHGKSGVVGYPLFADFNVNRYFDAYYLTAFIGPLIVICSYELLSRFGPLRRKTSARRAAREGAVPDGDEYLDHHSPNTNTFVRILRLFGVGALLGIEVQTAFGLNSSSALLTMAIAGVIYATTITVGCDLVERLSFVEASLSTLMSRINTIGIIAMIPILYQVSRSTTITIASTRTTVHYPWLPLWFVVVATLGLIAYVAHRKVRNQWDDGVIERNLVFFVAIPLTIFIVHAFIPGALGAMDPFGEGEYLAGGWLLMHGVLPWRNIYLIHGIFDDGIKGIIGFQVFGRTRWGATTGQTMLLTPLYWVFTYYFAAAIFARRSFFVIGVAASVILGVFVDWDMRYLFWPLILILLFRALQHRTKGRIIALTVALIAQAILVPELSLALPAVGLTIVAFELYERSERRLRVKDFPATMWTIITGLVVGAGFGLWLVSVRAFGGFIGYFLDYANSHSLTGGIPLWTSYAVASVPNALGVSTHVTAPPPFISRYSLEVYIPVVAIVATIALITVRVRSGRRLVIFDWLTIAAAGLVALYYQKSISRGDYGHIGEVFMVTVPLIILLVYRVVVGTEILVHSFFDRLVAKKKDQAHESLAKKPFRLGTIGTPAALLALVLVLVIAPLSLGAAVNPVPHAYSTAVPQPAPPPPVKGGPGLGYNVDALPPNVVTDIQRIFDTYAGTNGPVFDFSNSPAVVYYLLERKPVARFYDIGDIETPETEQLAIDDLEKSKPLVVLFNGVGMGSWDFIPNEIRDGLLSDYLLTHFRPIVLVNGQLLMIADSIEHPKPLPKLLGTVQTKNKHYALGACAFGFIPNFLQDPSSLASQTSQSVGFRVFSHTKKGTIYQLSVPDRLLQYHWISVTTTKTTGDIGLAISNIAHQSRRDISWVAEGSTTTDVEVASCLQWHAFDRVLYLRYFGTGTPSAVRFIR